MSAPQTPSAETVAVQLATAFLTRVWGPAHDVDAIDDLMTEDYVIHSAGTTIRGRTAFKEWVRQFHRVLSGAVNDVLDTFASADGSRVTSRWLCSGRNNGIFGLPADDRPVSFSGIAIWKVRDGRLAECWVERAALEAFRSLSDQNRSPKPDGPEDRGRDMKTEMDELRSAGANVAVDTLADGAALLEVAAERAAGYLRGIGARRVFPAPDAVAALDQLDGPLAKGGVDGHEILRLLDEVASPATVATTAGRYFGFVIGGAVPAAAAAGVLGAAWDQNTVMRATSPAAVRLEEIALAWARELLGLPEQARGALVTCTTVANATGLAAARHALLARQGWDVESRGLFGAPEIPVIVGEEVHVSVLKALAVIGFGRERVVKVPTDSQGRMRAEAFPRLTAPAIACIQAGNVNTGSFDPAEAVCDDVHKAGGWVHVDGAFGLWAASVPERAHLTRGMAVADSWATDGHKWLNVPYDCGFVYVREPEPLFRAMRMQADYLQLGRDWEPLHWTPDSSRRARGVEVWAALKALGRDGVADLVERTCRYAARFAERLRDAGFEILNEIVINQVLVSFGSDERTRDVIDAVQRDGTCWCGGTLWHGRQAMRISVSSWATTADDVEISADAIIRLANGGKDPASGHS